LLGSEKGVYLRQDGQLTEIHLGIQLPYTVEMAYLLRKIRLRIPNLHGVDMDPIRPKIFPKEGEKFRISCFENSVFFL
jgi:hypothetical protein